MKKAAFNSIGLISTLFLGFVIIGFASCSNGNRTTLQAKIDSLQTELKKFADEQTTIETYLTRFDSLDFDVFSNQQWDLLSVSHADDIVVNWPDGHSTKGIAKHIEDLKAMFVFAPDTRVESHPIKFGSGDWTCVTGIFAGTFTKPMPIGGGKTIPPTGKAFRLPMCTVAHWKDGKMIEESLFWDNQVFMRQIGLAK
ncbi:MAG: ester cyclase [Ignavibacteriae bacterium]|nr:ester cyclase [Ignavibacteriota bacterium]